MVRVLHQRRAALTQIRRRRSRAQSMVEFALVAPIFFALLFGLVEFSLIESSIAAFNFAAKDSARIGSFLGRSDSTVDQQIVSDIRLRVGGVVFAQTLKIEIYRSNTAGDLPTSGTPENVYDISGATIGTQTWPVDIRNDTLADADYLGVRISYQYTYLTGFVSGTGSTLPLYAISVQRIEPQDYQGWRHTPAPPNLTQRDGPALRAALGDLPLGIATTPVIWLAPRALARRSPLPSQRTEAAL